MLSFANPVFLWGLLGLAAPILIHLINRDLFRPVRFPSIRFILRGKLPVERKRRLRDLLLLALRMLLFAAIITALARPQWQPEVSAAALDEAEGELVILIDASASMGGWNVWDQAIDQAEELLASHQPDPAALVISGAGPVATEPLTTEHSRLRDLLQNSSPQRVAGDHRESLRQALRLFSGQGTQTLAVISDFQQSDWSPASLPLVDADVEINWLQVRSESRENVGIMNARALPLTDGRRQVVTEVRNFGLEETERTVTLRAGDESLSRPVTLTAGETRSLSFVLEEPSASQAEVTIDNDDYTEDDHYFLWLGRPPPIRVLVVAPTTEEPEKMEETFFLTRALTTRTETQWLDFAVNLIEPDELNEDGLRDVETVFLLGAAPYLNSTGWDLLHDHLADGGRVLFTPGKAPARQSTLLAQHEFIDLAYEGIAGTDRRQPRPHSIDWVKPDSPIDLLFRDEAARTLSSLSFYQYVRFDPRDENGSVLLRTTQDDPLLIEREVGAGLVLATAFPFQTSWNDLPVSTAFLPIIREWVAGDLPPDHGIVNLDTGPDATPIASRLDISADATALANIDPLSPGIHVIANTPVVLNAPRSESLPEFANPVDLQAAVTPAARSATRTTTASGGDQQVPLWPWLALAALLFFIIEMPLAARIRRLRQAEERPPNPTVAAEATTRTS